MKPILICFISDSLNSQSKPCYTRGARETVSATLPCANGDAFTSLSRTELGELARDLKQRLVNQCNVLACAIDLDGRKDLTVTGPYSVSFYALTCEVCVLVFFGPCRTPRSNDHSS